MPLPVNRTRDFLNVRIRHKAHDTLKSVAAARGLQLIELFDEFAKQYDPLVDPLRQGNGHQSAARQSSS